MLLFLVQYCVSIGLDVYIIHEPKEWSGILAQTNTIHGANNYFLLNNFKSVQNLVTDKQYQLGVNALNEEKDSRISQLITLATANA